MVELNRENPTITQTINNLRSVASYIVVMRRVARKALDEPPFIPEITDLAAANIDPAVREFMTTPTEFQDKIVAQGNFIFSQMDKRAAQQKKYFTDPHLFKENIRISFTTQMGLDALDIDFSNMEIAWGLFSYGLVLPAKEYEKMFRLHNHHPSKGVPGYVTGQLTGPLGRIPVVSRGTPNRGDTIDHEDIHILQEACGLSGSKYDLNAILITPEVERSLLQENIQPGDLNHSLFFLKAVEEEARRDIVIEMQTNSWKGNFVSSNVLDYRTFGFAQSALTAVINAGFDPTSGLSDDQKIRLVFESQKMVNEVNYDRLVLMQCITEARRSYKGDLSSSEWAAALTLLFTPDTPIKTIKAIMLGGRDKELTKSPQRTVAQDLAGAISTYSRRKVIPNSYGTGDAIPDVKFEEFIAIVESTFKTNSEVQQIVTEHEFSQDEVARTKNKLIDYVRKSAPEGRKAKLKKLIAQRLN